MKHLKLGMTLVLFVLAGCAYVVISADDPPPPPIKATSGDASAINAEVIRSDLRQPWGMAFLPDGSILVTEKGGNLKRIFDSAISAPYSGLPKIAVVGQGGLLDVALDPNFSENQLVYLSYSEPDPSRSQYGTAVGRGKLNTESESLEEFERIFSTNIKSSVGRHFGSRLRFANDGTLFITVGDRGAQPRAQDPFDHAGSVIRINSDGSIPEDNPFVDGEKALPEIWTTGHRNPQGAAIDHQSGTLWTLSHGARGGDEVNKVVKGENYGWPVISYGTNYSGTGFDKGHASDGFQQPAYYWDPSIAPSGMTFYQPENAQIPEWRGSLLAGALKARYLSRLILENDKVIAEEKFFEGQFGRIRDVRTGPDGAVWLLTDSGNGKLIRLTAKK